MKTTLEKINSHLPCMGGWVKLTKYVKKNNIGGDITFKQILDSNGIEDAVWALRALDYRDYCLFNADVVELGLCSREDKLPGDSGLRDGIEAIRKFHAGDVDFKHINLPWWDTQQVTGSASAKVSSVMVYMKPKERLVAWANIEKIFIKHFCKET